MNKSLSGDFGGLSFSGKTDHIRENPFVQSNLKEEQI